MLDDTIRKIREAEDAAEQQKAACRAELQRMLAEAQRQADELAVQAEETLRQEQAHLLDEAEKQAAAIRSTIREQTARACDLLRAQARRNGNRAIEAILEKGV